MAAPLHVLQRLTELAHHERRLRLLWGAARWMAVLSGVLILFCLLDWIVDRWYETPGGLRLGMRFVLLGLAIYLAYRWMIQPLRTGLSPTDLALWVEARDPRHEHRLISAVQLNDPTGDQSGMSPALIDAVTLQAESIAETSQYTGLVDGRRRHWSMYLLLAMALGMLIATLAFPQTAWALLRRQMGGEERIPRSIYLHSISEALFPSGEPVLLKFHVSGMHLDPAATVLPEGTVQVAPEGQLTEYYPLTYFGNGPSEGSVIFSATVPASSSPFSYRAWLLDGRTYQSEQVTFAPRPVLTSWEAWLRLPTYLGDRGNGQPFEIAQPKGDLSPIPGAAARLQVNTQTPIVEALAEWLGPLAPTLGCQINIPTAPISIHYLLQAQQLQGWTPSFAGPLFPIQRTTLQLSPEGTSGTATVALRVEIAAYRVLVKDQHGFTNRPIPRRAVNFKPDERPQVTLLPERFNAPSEGPEEVDLEGMPLPLGRPLRIAYRAQDDYALASAILKYRVNEGPWRQLELTKVPAKPPAVFDLSSGAFSNSSAKEQVPFHIIPPAQAGQLPKRSQGGGRFDFQTRALPDLKVGDVVEYLVEVGDQHTDPLRQPGHSDIRRKSVVSEAQFVEWVVQTLQQENRLRQLERQQRRVFDPSSSN